MGNPFQDSNVQIRVKSELGSNTNQPSMTSMSWVLRTARAPARAVFRQRRLPQTATRCMCTQTPPPQAGAGTSGETGVGSSPQMNPAITFPHSATGRPDRLYSGVDIELRAHQPAVLKSAFVHSKHRVQYEMRTYFWVLNLGRVTESTKDTYLEYIQRNLPEGVAMKVTTREMRRLPEEIRENMGSDA